jgi:fatty-acyl-CoA synthase
MRESYVAGPTDVPLLEVTVGAALEDAAARWGDRDALISVEQGHRMSYAQLDAAATRLAAGLVRLGLQPGDRIGIWAPNGSEWVVTQFATAKAGLILVNINPAYQLSELQYALTKVACKALVLAPRYRNGDYVEMIRTLLPQLPALRSLILIDDEPRPGFLSFAEVADYGRAEDLALLRQIGRRLLPTDPINIQFTSGTTGQPKGATLTHRNIVNNARFTARQMRFTEQDRLCIPVPLYHCFGMVMGVLGCVTTGAAMILPSAMFDARAVLRAIEAERCTAVYGVPTMFIAQLGLPDFASYDVSSLRTGCMAGAPCPIEVMKRVVTDLNLREVTIGYGMTETSPISFQSDTEDALERRVATVGRVHPHVEVKIVDAEGAIVPRGTSGEILTRGYSVMLGYWHDPERTAECIDAAGWMRTGDLGVLDEDGYCNIVGRSKDLIIRGGENISPREVEEFLFTHPRIESAAVFGIPDARFGEVVCAWIRLAPGAQASEAEIRAFCRGRIAHFKIPQHVRFVQEFPMTVTGKIQKFVMRQSMAAQLRAPEAITA